MNTTLLMAGYLIIAALFTGYLWGTGDYKDLRTPIFAGLCWIIILPVLLLVFLTAGVFIVIAFINIKRSKANDKIVK